MSKEFDLDYEKDMEIDPDRLDVAALEQANLAMQYSKEAAHYEREAKRAHEKLKTIRSQLVKDVSEDPEGCLGKGLKATAPTIEAYYRNDKGYQEAKTRLIDAEYNRDLAKAAADHISFQRKKMIEVLAQLLQSEYFAGPAVPHDLAGAWREQQKVRRGVGESAATDALSRRRRR